METSEATEQSGNKTGNAQTNFVRTQWLKGLVRKDAKEIGLQVMP